MTAPGEIRVNGETVDVTVAVDARPGQDSRELSFLPTSDPLEVGGTYVSNGLVELRNFVEADQLRLDFVRRALDLDNSCGDTII